MLCTTRLAALFSLGQLFAIASAQTATATQTEPAASDTATGTVTSAPAATDNSSSSPRGPMVHTVNVGNGGFSFDPEELTDVLVGDTVTL
jgi:plastocyanin